MSISDKHALEMIEKLKAGGFLNEIVTSGEMKEDFGFQGRFLFEDIIRRAFMQSNDDERRACADVAHDYVESKRKGHHHNDPIGTNIDRRLERYDPRKS